MRRSLALVVTIGIASLTAGGCAQQNRRLAQMQRENAELKAKVASLELQLRDLKDTQPGPVTVDGLTFAPMQLPELRWRPKPVKPAETTAKGNLMLSGVGSIPVERGIVTSFTPASRPASAPIRNE